MRENNVKEAWNQKQIYLKHLGDVETWLITVSKNSVHIGAFAKDSEKISESCSYVVENFYNEIDIGMGVDKQIMIVVGILNALIRVYAIDKSGIITSQEYFQSISNIFLEFLKRFEGAGSEDNNDDDDDDDDDEQEEGKGGKQKDEDGADSSDSSATKLSNRDLERYRAVIFDSILANFAQDDLLKKCLGLYFSNTETATTTGSGTTNEQCSMIGHHESRKAMISIVEYMSASSYYIIIRSMDEFSEKYQSVMTDLCSFVDGFFADVKNISSNNLSMNVVCSVLTVVWNLSATIPLVPMFVDAGYAEKTLNWIGKLSVRDDTEELTLIVISIIHNLSRQKNGLQALREQHAFETLMKCKPLLKLETKEKLDDMSQTFGMALIALATSDSEQKENEELIRKISDKLYSMCQKAAHPENKLMKSEEYHLSDLLNSLDRAFSNTSIIRHILGNKSEVKPEPIKFFAQLLVSSYGLLFDQELDYLEEIMEKSLLRLLLCISNYEEYRQELKNHDQFCVLIEGLAKRSKQDLVKRIWCNLNLSEKSIASSQQKKTEKQPMIFVSYHGANRDLCANFVNELKQSTNIPVWIDYENIVGWYNDDEWDTIADAIECATVFIVLVSSTYCQSTSKFQELNYAVQLSQNGMSSFIFVELEPGTANMREWLGSLINELSKANEIISYNDNMERTIQEILEKNTFLKKRALVTRLTGTITQSRICTLM